MKKIFLVDTENMGMRFVPGANQLDSKDKIILFNNEGNLTALIQELTSKTSANIDVISMANHRKNAMDFQICTYLGMLVNQYGKEYEYYIVSADRGYEASMEFIISNADKGTVIKEVINLKCEKTGELARMTIDEILQGFSKKVRREAAAGLKKTHTLGAYHNYLQENLPIDGHKIYQLIKPCYDNIRLAF